LYQSGSTDTSVGPGQTEGCGGRPRAYRGDVHGPSVGDLAVRWQLDPAAVLVVLLAGGLYAVGVRRLARRGRTWPLGRSLAAAGAGTAALLATQSGIARFDADRFWVHMVQHVLLGMVVPLLAVLAAPATLALQTAATGTRRALRRGLHGRACRTLARPLVGLGLFGGGLVALYLTPLLDLAARDDLVHVAVHTHMVAAGAVFLAPLVGADPLPARPTYGARLLVLLVAVPVHAVVALALTTATSPVAPLAYPGLDDQRTAAALLWGSGELLTLVAAAIVVRQWWLSELRAERRETDAPAGPPARVRR
jgi:putative copper resistance protein D